MRITDKDAQETFQFMVNAARDIGVDTMNLMLITGSNINGNAYGVRVVDPDGGGHGRWHYAPESLGFTAREAVQAMNTIANVFRALAYDRRND